ncbi:MAG: hypothetical protein UV43_C0042G0001, partial [Parcubacteria group bacterium GW2011_GWF2_42_7]
AWPSSVRGLNCTLKWANERNPRCVLQVSHETARPSAEVDLFGTRPSTDIEFQFRQWDLLLDASTSVAGREEGEDDARSACPFDILGYTHNTMATTTRSDGATLS